MIYKWLKNNLPHFFSRHCLLCLSPTPNHYRLCDACADDLAINTQRCIICSAPIQGDEFPHNGLVCGQCQKEKPAYLTSTIPHIYTEPLKQVIGQLKFQYNLTVVPLLANNFLNHLVVRQSGLPECIIPVPLHPERLRQRGFNQSLEIARIISDKTGIPLEYTLCKRDKSTSFQTGLSARQRKQNLKNAFSLAHDHQYQHVVIFDDIVTTGSTANELARLLRESGVEKIEVWAIARTQFKKDT